MLIVSIPTVENVTKDRRDFFQRESYQRVFNESRSYVNQVVLRESRSFSQKKRIPT
jgi:hypothetical protein